MCANQRQCWRLLRHCAGPASSEAHWLCGYPTLLPGCPDWKWGRRERETERDNFLSVTAKNAHHHCFLQCFYNLAMSSIGYTVHVRMYSKYCNIHVHVRISFLSKILANSTWMELSVLQDASHLPLASRKSSRGDHATDMTGWRWQPRVWVAEPDWRSHRVTLHSAPPTAIRVWAVVEDMAWE